MKGKYKSTIRKIDSAKFYHVDPRSVLDDVNTTPELYYLSNLINNRSKINSEIPLVIGQEAYSKLVTFYGGTMMYVPTKDELQDSLIGVMSYYYYSVQGMSWSDTMSKLGLTPNKGNRRLLRNRWKLFKELIENNTPKIPQLGIESPSTGMIKPHKAPMRCSDGTYVDRDVYIKVVKSVLADLQENNKISEQDFKLLMAEYEKYR